jgi:DNA-binding CsgD family transcriptional regulator
MKRAKQPLLTRAEHEVISQLIRGLSNKQISSALGKKPSTVKNQISTLLKKYRCASRLQLVLRLIPHTLPAPKLSSIPRRQRLLDLWRPEFVEPLPASAARRTVA